MSPGRTTSLIYDLTGPVYYLTDQSTILTGPVDVSSGRTASLTYDLM